MPSISMTENQMLKVLYLAELDPNNNFGSLMELIMFLSAELRNRRHICYLGFIAYPEPDIRRKFEAVGARVLKIDYEGWAKLGSKSKGVKIHEIVSLYRIIKENKIDLVHINFFYLTKPYMLGVFLSEAKVVFTDHTSGLPLSRNFLKYAMAKALHFFISRRVSKYIANSDYVRNRLRKTHHVSGDKTVTIYNGVNLERFKPMDSILARNQLGLPLEKKILCSVSMLIPEKGLQHLLEAAALLVHDYGIKDLLIVIAGEGYYRNELEKMCIDLHIEINILFLDNRGDVQAIVAASDIVVVPSVWEEAFGLIIAEAMASARPVVASRIGGIPELVENGVTGLTVKPADAVELATALCQLLESPDKCRCMGAAGLNKATKEFNLAQQVKKLADLYDKC